MNPSDTTVGPSAGASQLLAPTSHQILRPFYPLNEPSKGGDLTQLAGRSSRAEGQLLYLSGRVLNRKAEPVREAKMEIWQANSLAAIPIRMMTIAHRLIRTLMVSPSFTLTTRATTH
jgi:hypothetical protein